ncbi:MxaJ protein [Oxalobacteraceae bacterium IMCC9480]|nr:MxaJ protein [Oxalobacteraceae bacterium IMCC9480]NDP59911.1 quinoprotein dehydrogenase-associated putative ABC transporter substrate-binding protein [Oxalobacteraceae bacterium]
MVPLIRPRRRLAISLCAGLLALSAPAMAQDGASTQKILRVCQDPNNLPMSDQQERGYENKIAELFASKLGWKLEHSWYPQRMGFIRNSLKAKIDGTDTFKCDVVTGVSTDFEMGLVTQPYLASTYAMAFVKGKGLDAIKTPADLLALPRAIRDKLKIGIFARSPAADWLLKNGLIGQMVSYSPQTGDPDQYPGQLIDRDLANGTVDVAIAWGPIVGYFAKQAAGAPVTVVSFKPVDDGIRYGFSIAMGVRYGDNKLRDQLNALIASSQPEIAQIFRDYGVPVTALPAPKAAAPS